MTAALDLGKDLVVHWPGATADAAPLLEQWGARAVVTDLATRPLPYGRGSVLAAVDIDGLGAARQAGFDGAALTAPTVKAELDRALREFRDFVSLVYLTPEQIHWDVRPAHAVLKFGVWPGIAAQDINRASATASVWLDANTSLIAQLRAQYPWRRAILAYQPDAKLSLPASAAEVSLADAWSAGGSVVLWSAAAMRAGTAPGGFQQFLRSAAAASDAPLAGRTAVLCGTIEETGEILNLAFRKNLCPVAVRGDAPLPLSPARFDVVVAANIDVPPPVIENIARYAENGGAVLAAPVDEKKTAWWTTRGWKKLRTEEDRDVYAAGRGEVYGYHAPVYDPGGFALDVKDVAGQRSQPGLGLKNLDLRIWSADSVLGVLHRLTPKSIAVVLTAYGNLPRHDFLISIRGRYRRASMRQPGETAAREVRLMPRSGRAEINLAKLARVAVLTLEE